MPSLGLEARPRWNRSSGRALGLDFSSHPDYLSGGSSIVSKDDRLICSPTGPPIALESAGGETALEEIQARFQYARRPSSLALWGPDRSPGRDNRPDLEELATASRIGSTSPSGAQSPYARYPMGTLRARRALAGR